MFSFRELEEEEVSLKEALSEGRKGLLKAVEEATDNLKVFQGRQVRFVSSYWTSIACDIVMLLLLYFMLCNFATVVSLSPFFMRYVYLYWPIGFIECISRSYSGGPGSCGRAGARGRPCC